MTNETSIGGDVRFQPTLWSTILRARDGESDASRAALGRLIERYWKPLYFFIRRRGYDVEQAKDLSQAFFEHTLERDFLRNVAPEKGRFRTWLLKAMTHFLSDERERSRATKRGGGRVASLDVDLAERQLAASVEPPDRAFLRSWATEVLERTLERLRDEWIRQGREEEYSILVRHLSGSSETYAGTGERLGIPLHDVKNKLHGMRVRLRELLREEVAPSLEDPAEADAELADLFDALT
ncbi:MAG: sigma-70 family RNA polymerase sigma factor [Planctomycetes bacterium]|nr:sigma-70 family RNA polymerase sigma factor [Planctomycetota bacterium]